MLKLAKEVDGRAPASELAEEMGLGEKTGGSAISVRLTWMAKYGMVEYDKKEHEWLLSPGGQRVTQAHLRAAQARTLGGIPDESLVEVMSHVVQRYQHGDAMTAHMLRREFQFGTHRRNSG